VWANHFILWQAQAYGKVVKLFSFLNFPPDHAILLRIYTPRTIVFGNGAFGQAFALAME
jgi:hypothetical protein